MSGYSSDGVLSISSTSDSIFTKNHDCEEKGQPAGSDSTKHAKKPWYADSDQEVDFKSDTDLAIRGTTVQVAVQHHLFT
jgi:hypothetical protein